MSIATGDGDVDEMAKQEKVRITAQVLNGATGEVRQVIANVAATDEQDAVNKLFSHARKG